MRKAPTIAINVLAVKHQGDYMAPWQVVIKELWGKGEGQSWTVKEVIDQLIATGLYSDTNTQPKFTGTLHCEACLISLMSTGALQQDIKEVSASAF
jgi:hypothetical protein